MLKLKLLNLKLSLFKKSNWSFLIASLPVVLGAASSRGAVLLSDNFSSGSYSPNWTTYYGDSANNAIFSASAGGLSLTCRSFCGDARAVAGSTNWTDYTLEVDFQRVSGNDAAANVLFRVQEIGDGCDNGKYYQLMLKETALQLVEIDYSGGGAPLPPNWNIPLSSPLAFGEWHHLKLTLAGTTATVQIDGGQEYQLSGLTHYLFGKIGFKSINAGCASLWDNIVVTDNQVVSTPPSVNVKKAVKPSLSNLLVGTNYQLQVSADLTTWTNAGSTFTATNTSMVYPQYWDVDNWGRLFFRLQVAP